MKGFLWKGDFFHMKNPNKKLDSELVQLYLAGDIQAQQELVARYRIYSCALAKVIRDSFRSSPAVEFDDLVAIGLYSLHVAVCHYKESEDQERPLYPYWKAIAINEMMDYVKEFSAIKENGFMFFSLGVEFYEKEFSFAGDGGRMLLEEIDEFLANPKNNISYRDQNIFLDYLGGMKLVDISKKYRTSFVNAKRIVDKIRSKIISELL